MFVCTDLKLDDYVLDNAEYHHFQCVNSKFVLLERVNRLPVQSWRNFSFRIVHSVKLNKVNRVEKGN